METEISCLCEAQLRLSTASTSIEKKNYTALYNWRALDSMQLHSGANLSYFSFPLGIISIVILNLNYETMMLLKKIKALFFTLLLTVITVLAIAQAPGGVPGAALWLRADKGATAGSSYYNVPAVNRTASSFYPGQQASESTLSSATAWSASTGVTGDNLTLDLGSVQTATGVVTKGRADGGQWVTSYTVSYSTDNIIYTSLGAFTGNGDQNTEVVNMFGASVSARYIRFTVTGFRAWPSMRADVVQPGTVITTDNVAMGTWQDQGPAGNAVSQTVSGSQPMYRDNPAININFNPVITFNGTTQRLIDANGITGTGSYTNAAALAVGATAGTSNNTLFQEGLATGTRLGMNAPFGDNKLYWDGAQNSSISAAWGGTLNVPYLWTGWNNNSQSPKASLRRNGLQIASSSTLNTYVGNNGTLAVGSAVSGASDLYNGKIADLIVFTSALTAAERNKVESYLAIKYGITLDQSTAQNYVSSNGTVVWDTTTNNGYGNNIAGIGLDNGSSLSQKQSQSVNGGIQPVIANVDIAATNSSNINGFTNDQSFLIWGSDNGSFQFGTAFNFGGLNNRMTRIWKVQETGTVGTVKVALLTSQITVSNPTLIISNDNVFDGTDTRQAMILETLGGVTYYTTTVDFTTGQYFTFAGFITAPGGVVAGLKIWHKADAGVTAVSGAVTAWTNQVDGRQAVNTAANQRPVITTGNSLFNFNPYLDFTSTSSTLYDAGATPFTTDGDISYFVSVKPPAASDGQLFAINATPSQTGTGSYDTFEWYYTNAFSNSTATYNPSLIGMPQSIVTFTHDGLNNLMNANANLIPIINNAAYPAQLGSGGYVIGADFGIAGGDNSGAIAQYSELAAYNRVLTLTEIQKIQSYLAIKGGVSLNQSYLMSSGSAMWDATINAAYKNNIAGIGHDDASALNQKQSQSVNGGSQLVVALGSIATSNANNNNTFASDQQFLIWGDDNGSLSPSITTGNSTYPRRFARVWKMQNSGTFNQAITVYYPQSAFGNAPLSSIAMLYGNSVASLNNGNATAVAQSGTTIINGASYYVFTITDASVLQYFSFTASIVSPGGIASPTLWYRADAGITASSGTVSQWNNAADVTNNLVREITGATLPAYNNSSNLMNFNPSLRFDGVDDRLYIPSMPLGTVTSGVSPYATSHYVVFRRLSANTQNLFGSTTGNYNVGSDMAGHLITAGTYVTIGSSAINDIQLQNFDGNSSTASGYANGKLISTTIGGSLATAATQPFFMGSGNGGAFGNADIAEVIVYNSAQGASRQQIESYLAIKYGITLDQTTPRNYQASDGSAVWNATTNASFNNNIAGIGRDDASALNQKQSQSANSGVQPVIANVDIASTNAANNNNFSNDLSFLLWGNDNGSTQFGTAFNFVGLNNRMTRTWKVQETGTVGIVKVALPVSQVLASNPTLIISNDNVFDGTDTRQTMILETLGGVQYYTTTVDFTTGQYFTFAGFATAPGGVVAGLTSWYKENNLNTGTVWKNAANSNDATGTGTNVYNTSGADLINYNPSYTFNTSGVFNLPAALDISGSYSITGVAKLKAAGSNGRVFGSTLGDAIIGYYGNLMNTIYYDGNPFSLTSGSNGAVSSTTDVKNYTYIRNAGPFSFYGNSASIFTGASSSANGYRGTIGGASGQNSNVIVPEFITYSTALSATDQNKVESYLAIKYGYTKSGNYVNAAGNAVWSNGGGYDNNIAGIGREDASALSQKQSQSVSPNTNGQVAIGLGTIATSNILNTTSFFADKTFLMWGDNGITQNLAVASTAFNYNGFSNNVRMNRVWQVQNNGVSQSVTIQFPTASVGTAASPSGSCTQYVIIYSTDPSFASGVTAAVPVISGANYSISRKFPQGVSYFTFAKVSQQAPGTVSLPVANSNSISASACINAPGWKYYYYDAGQTQKVFSINWNGNTEPGGVSGVLTYSGSAYTQTNASYQCNIMGRMLEILPAGGSYTVNGGVKVRIFFDSTEMNSQLAPSALSQRWFKVSGDAAAAIAANNGQNITGAQWLTPSATGEEDGVDYVEFSSIQSFSTFGFASNTGAFPLPVTILSFTGSKQGTAQALLNWEVENEYQFDRFEVEQSSNGTLYTTVGTVQSRGGNSRSSYSTSVMYSGPVSYYRLKLVDKNGAFRYSAVIVLKGMVEDRERLAVYPNPVKGEVVTVQISGYQGSATVKVYDQYGRVVLPSALIHGNGVVMLNVSSLASGAYYIRAVNNATGVISNTEKLLLVR